MKTAALVLALVALVTSAVAADPVPVLIPVTPTPSPSPGPTPTPITAYATAVPIVRATTRAVYTTAPTSRPMPMATVLLGSIPIPMHEMTADFQMPTSCASAAPYLTFEYPGTANTTAACRAVQIHVVRYTDAVAPIAPDYEYKPLMAYGAAARDCSGNIITYPSEATGVYTDVFNPNASPYFASQLLEQQALNPQADVAEIDHFGADVDTQNVCNFPGFPAWNAQLARQVLTQTWGWWKVIGNANWPHQYVTPPAGMTVASSVLPCTAIDGCMIESAFVGAPVSTKVATGQYWIGAANAIMALVAANRDAWAVANQSWSNQWAANAVADRIYVYASVLLAGDPWDTVYWVELHTPSGFQVLPESGLVCLGPTATASTVSGYVDSAGLYVRSFASCYFRGAPVGPALVAVNPGTTSDAFTYAGTYKYVLSVSGGSVLDPDAWVGATSPAPSSVPAGSAVIAFTQQLTPMGATPPPVITPTPSATP